LLEISRDLDEKDLKGLEHGEIGEFGRIAEGKETVLP